MAQSRCTGSPLGRVKGPGEKPHTFLMVAPDPDQVLKLGEFIIYRASVEDENQDVLARVIERRPLRLYPDGFMADPGIDPNEIAATIGYSGTRSELFEIVCQIIGYYNPTMHDFVNPRVSPRVGTPVFLAGDDYLSGVLSRKKAGEEGSATMGWLSSRVKDRVKVALDINEVASMHLAIIANTGAGKSYAASVLIEEMLRPENRAAILVIDPHGEYNTLDQVANKSELSEGQYRPQAHIKKPGSIKIRVGTLAMGDLLYLLPNVSDRMAYVLGDAYRYAQGKSRRRTEKYTDRWTINDLVDYLDDDDREYADSAKALIWRLRSTIKTGKERVFDDEQQHPLMEFIQPGLCTVMQLDQIDQQEQQVIVATMLRRIYQARLQTTRGEAKSREDDHYLPYPVFILIEEAHNFAPANANVISTGILKRILSEGRKFGVGVGLISQRPGKLDSDVLSQCNTQFLLRIVNPVDQARVAESVESIGRDLMQELPSLNKGQAIISGAGVNTPVICQIRERYTDHGGQSADAVDEWVRYDTKERQREERDHALPLGRSSRMRDFLNDEDA